MNTTLSCLWISFLFLTLTCCTPKDSAKEKYQSKRDHVIHVKDHIVDIETEIIIGKPWLYIFEDYLIVCDTQNPDKGIHLFDKNTYEHVATTGTRGHGPGEIVRYGHFAFDKVNRLFYVSDDDKQVVFVFALDEVLKNPDYLPKRAFKLDPELFPATFDFINESTLIGSAIQVVSNSSFNHTVVSYNMESKELKEIGKAHPKVNPFKLTVYFDLSQEEGIYIQGYASHDLLSVSNLKGELLYYIYGPQWEKKRSKNHYYYVSKIMGDKIIAAFLGEPGVVLNEQKRPRSVSATKFLVFDTKDGSYEKTLDTDSGIFYFCVDDENQRIITYYKDREIPLGYIDLDEISE